MEPCGNLYSFPSSPEAHSGTRAGERSLQWEVSATAPCRAKPGPQTPVKEAGKVHQPTAHRGFDTREFWESARAMSQRAAAAGCWRCRLASTPALLAFSSVTMHASHADASRESCRAAAACSAAQRPASPNRAAQLQGPRCSNPTLGVAGSCSCSACSGEGAAAGNQSGGSAVQVPATLPAHGSGGSGRPASFAQPITSSASSAACCSSGSQRSSQTRHLPAAAGSGWRP